MFYKMRRRAKYLEEADTEHGLVSYNALDTEDYTGEEIITDRNEDSVADIVVRNLMVEKLHLCIPLLSVEDHLLIKLIYWERKTETEIGGIMGITQQGISKRLVKVLKTLRKHLES